MSVKKYRPYFTLAELEALASFLPSEDPKIYPLRRYLMKYTSDIRSDLRLPNIELAPTIEDSLGLSDSAPDTKTPEELFRKYKISNGLGMSAKDLESALKYGYENDMLSAAEEMKFEKSQGIGGF